ncbi:hypothetical protein Zmor_024135 [Zophobas morio]|uniref:BTB domain-containing protein n=1 Tax=Zophobas morio TaxID=2755281 RepID=A0AA38M7T2_9CUCU|nr:hypothetical protein Zmor_024135 [Zophobas morio]
MTTNASSLKLSRDISLLYLNERYSDVTLIVNDERLYAHKMILAVRSEYFEALFYGGMQESLQTEIHLSDVSSNTAFKLLLKYIYGACIPEVTSANTDLNLEVLILAQKYCMLDLQDGILEQLKTVINLDNICSILNVSNQYSFMEIRDTCHHFVESKPLEFLRVTNFKDLSKDSLSGVLKRSTFYAPEIEIFNAVVQWCQKNKFVDDEGRLDESVLRCVRLSWIEPHNLMSVVWPTGLVNNEYLLKSIAESMGVKQKEVSSRGIRILNKNVATPADKAEVLSNKDSCILEGPFRDLDLCERVKIRNKKGVIIKLGVPTFINYIGLMLYSKHDECYCYYIEVSVDRQNWKRIIDYSQYVCRGVQYLYFDEVVALYIRVMGTYSSVDEIRIMGFRASYKTSCPQSVNGITRPVHNIVTKKMGALIISGMNGDNLIYNVKRGSLNASFAYHWIHTDTEIRNITVQFNQPYLVSNILLLLCHENNRTYKYYIETSVNTRDWEMLADYRNEVNVQPTISFEERVVVFIRFVGTLTSANDVCILISY